MFCDHAQRYRAIDAAAVWRCLTGPAEAAPGAPGDYFRVAWREPDRGGAFRRWVRGRPLPSSRRRIAWASREPTAGAAGPAGRRAQSNPPVRRAIADRANARTQASHATSLAYSDLHALEVASSRASVRRRDNWLCRRPGLQECPGMVCGVSDRSLPFMAPAPSRNSN